ncbi:hypothetical protein MAPG_11064 [Magnaporthiopsis poae ATCC 64411]|uniref:Nephrocystin 3-like N-terminal domain-containing protein n=1 Tax=Magnaporthiopsis poae (strain ATCC 64411 / 73-15) TaxID=644358 RepID=A0A0C4EE96_MAGP6|nr:hypothetical protein MAPG_11064 [Magnaporthiopsis poae ATCC 64411]
MSGLEPVAALGLACNILQVIGVGLDTIRVAKQVYKDGALDPALTESASALENISSQILRATASTSPVSATSTSTTSTSTRAGAARAKSLDKQLSELADKCQGAARDLREEVNFLNGHSTKTKLVATLKITAKTTWRKRRLEKLEGRLKDAQGLLQTSLMARIDERLEKSNSDLSRLDAKAKLLIDEYRSGKIDICKLIATEAAHTKAHVTAETAKSEKAVKDHVTETSDQLARSLRNDISQSAAQRDGDARLAARRERLLRSLKFDRMNERRNQVTPSHSGTFYWVLRDGSDGASSSDSTEASVQDVSWDRYSDWLRSTAPVYWISGKPGSGKTTLMKYLFNDDLTKAFLNVWKSGVVLVSHFFWAAGKEMQRSIKGMLCSLLHQLLLKEPQFTDQLLRGAKFGAALDKDQESDWSSEELLVTLHEVLNHYPKPIAIFLDGLDEVLPKDGALRLLDVIEELRQLDPQAQRLKMCLGSRREPLFQRRLCSFPQLRLERVNFWDLQKYGVDNIKVPPDYHSTILCHDWETRHISYFFRGKTPPSCDFFRDWLVHELLEKAEGVFLWLCLTVKAVTKALHQGETVEDLEHRIEKLPTDLEDLYADMWARTGAESAPIRNRAGSYFQLATVDVLPWTSLTSIFDFMVATTPTISTRLFAFETKGPAPAASLISACEATRRDIEVACAGLLVCSSPVDIAEADELEWMIRESRFLPWYGEEYDMLIPHMQGDVYFLHRTARDFLTDTETGQRILACGSFPGTLPHYKCIESVLAGTLIMRESILFHDGALAPCQLTNILESITLLPEDSHGNYDSMNVPRLQLLRLCERVFNTGHIRADAIVPAHCFDLIQQAGRSYHMARQTTVGRQHEFLLRAARTPMYGPGCDQIWSEILRAVTSRNVDDEAISELLICACSICPYPTSQYHHIRPVVEKLLDLGASPVWNGPWTINTIQQNTAELTAHTTAFKELIGSVWMRSLCGGVGEDPQMLLQLVSLLLSHGSSLEEEVYIAIHFYDGGTALGRMGGIFFCDNTPNCGPSWTSGNTTLIVAYPAAALLASAIQLFGLGDASRVNGFSQAPGMTKIRFEQGQLIAVIPTNGTDSMVRFETPNVYPVAPGAKLDKDLARLLEVVGRNLRNARSLEEWGVDIPLDVQQGVIRAVKRMRSENVPAVDRIREFRERVGICTPFEEWLEHDKWPLWDEEWDEDRVNIRPKKGMVRVTEDGEGAGEEGDDEGDDVAR